jgi:alpha-N-arabinofuranosidase
MTHGELEAVNTAENKGNVAPSAGSGATVANGVLKVSLPPHSYQMIRVKS